MNNVALGPPRVRAFSGRAITVLLVGIGILSVFLGSLALLALDRSDVQRLASKLLERTIRAEDSHFLIVGRYAELSELQSSLLLPESFDTALCDVEVEIELQSEDGYSVLVSVDHFSGYRVEVFRRADGEIIWSK